MDQHQDLSLFWFVTFYGLFQPMLPSLFVKILMLITGCDSLKQVKLRNEINDYQKELNKISMVDEFARYAKIQRRQNKVKQELKSMDDSKNYFLIKIKYVTLFVVYVLNGILTSYLMWNYRYEPLLMLPSTEIFYPVGWILSFPTGVSGGIGLTPWMAISFYTGRKLILFKDNLSLT